MLRGCKRNKIGCEPIEISLVYPLVSLVPEGSSAFLIESGHRCSLVESEVSETHQALFLGLPHTVNNILYSDAEVRLAVTCISERHQRWFCLCDGC